MRSVTIAAPLLVKELAPAGPASAWRFLHGNIEIELETRVVLDGRERRGPGDAIAHAHRHVADDAGACPPSRVNSHTRSSAAGSARPPPSAGPRPCAAAFAPGRAPAGSWRRPRAAFLARSACWRANAASASRAALTDSRLDTAACCDVASTSNSTLPGATRSPDFTWTLRRKPSTCDCTVVGRQRLHGADEFTGLFDRLFGQRLDFDGHGPSRRGRRLRRPRRAPADCCTPSRAQARARQRDARRRGPLTRTARQLNLRNQT